MALHVRIHTPREPRSILKSRPRSLLNCTEPPQSPFGKGNSCDATDGGRSCSQSLASDGPLWCKKHLGELKDLSAKWNRAQKEAERIEAVDPDTAKQKTIKLRQAVDLRRQIRDRFYPRGGDTADYLKWIL